MRGSIQGEPLRVFFGDSITAGNGASAENKRWVNLVAESRGWRRWRNAGISSTTLQNSTQHSVATIGAAVENNGRDTYRARILTGDPTTVFILYGLNDLRLNDAGFSVAAFANALGEVVDGLITGGMQPSDIVIGSPPYIKPSAYRLFSPWTGATEAKFSAYRAACAAVAAAKGARYADVYAAMVAGGGDHLVSDDGVHPNDAGHQAIANAFLSVL